MNLQSLDDCDPHVDRLLEGVAYLTGQIRRHIDHDAPDFAECLLQQLCPSLLRPFPSVTMMACTPIQGLLQKTYYLERGFEFQSDSVGEEGQKAVCKFRSTSRVAINPVRILALNTEEANGGTVLRLVIQADPGVDLRQLDLANIRLFLSADTATATALYYALTYDLCDAQVRFPEYPRHRASTRLAIRPCYLEVDEAMLPTAGRDFFGFQLLQEYFACKEKFLFVNIEGMHQADWPGRSTQIELRMVTNTKFSQAHRVDDQSLRLHCVPAVNLFEMGSEPIELTHRRVEYPLVVDADNRLGIQPYEVDKVVGVADSTGECMDYSALHSFQHRDGRGPYYSVRRRVDSGKCDRLYLSVGGTTIRESQTLSCTVTASNGFYPRRFLREKSVTNASAEVKSFLRCANLTRPTQFLKPPDRDDYTWVLLSHLSMSYRSMSDIDLFKRLLEMLEWGGLNDGRRRIEGIREIHVRSIQRIKRGGMVGGLLIRMTLSEECYRSMADIHLFGVVLHRFFCMAAPVNQVVELSIRCHPSNKELKWDSRFGVMPII